MKNKILLRAGGVAPPVEQKWLYLLILLAGYGLLLHWSYLRSIRSATRPR